MAIKLLNKLLITCSLVLFISHFSKAQNSSISGKILDQTGEPVLGVTVKVPGSTYGTTTDDKGYYKLMLPAGNYTIEYSYLGYTNIAVKVNLNSNQNLTLNQTMREDSKALDEAVAIGYATKQKRDLTGSQVSLKGKEINDMPAQSFEAGIQGKASGVQLIMGSGLAGSGTLIRVRGVASLSAGGDPLYVVDGIPITQDYFLNGNGGAFNNNPLATINPEDIEDIQILKDAAATSIYGSRGSNGVVLITTKRASKKGLSFDFNTRLSVSLPTIVPQMLNAAEFIQLYQEAHENDGNTGMAILPNGISREDGLKNNTNWVDETVGIGFKQLYSLGMSYRKKKFGVYGNYTWNENESFIKGSKYRRSSGRINADYKLSKTLTFMLSSSLSRGTNYRVDAGWSGGYGAAISTALPIYPIYDSTGYSQINPNPNRYRDLRDWRTYENRSINNLKAIFTPNKKLTVTGSLSYDYMKLTQDLFEPKELINSTHSGFGGYFTLKVHNYNYNVVANYELKNNIIHKVNVMVGTEYQKSKRTGDLYTVNNVTGPEREIGLDMIKSISDTTDNSYFKFPVQYDAFNSYFARIDYTYKKKYIAQLTARTDGSSKFGPNNRYGFFPAVSAAWILSDEPLFKKYKSISFLKLRAGIGVTGNAQFASNQWLQLYTVPGTGGVYNNTPIVNPLNAGNPDLKWENSKVLDVSLEFALYKSRISGEISYYNKKTEDVLTTLTVPPSTGFTEYYANVGTISNKGIEFQIKSTMVQRGNFAWTTDFNIARNYNKILSLGIYSQDALGGGTNDTRVVVGKPVGTNYLVRFDHINDEGRPVYLDKDGNQTLTWNNADRVEVGSVLPKAFGGLTNDFRYKNWSLSILLVYKIGGNIYNSSEKRQNGIVTDWNMTTSIFDRWQQPGDDARYPRLTKETSTYGLPPDPYQNNTTLWLYDGTYYRVRNIGLGYNLPKKWFKNKINSARVTVSGTNLFTFSKFKESDPEIARDFENAADRNMSSNITYLTAPQEKTYNLSINLTF
ncbi:MAG: SusC/RagA family TonB-linked outer membrane protein [Flavobacteriales bacterium]|nr:SusC/RagA family TonB-linked outer membrane protein [Flavobacteriales bacterium]